MNQVYYHKYLLIKLSSPYVGMISVSVNASKALQSPCMISVSVKHYLGSNLSQIKATMGVCEPHLLQAYKPFVGLIKFTHAPTYILIDND